MRYKDFYIKFAILLCAQVLLMNFFNFSQYIVLSFLPVMIMFVPIHRGTTFNLVLAFVSGFLVDFFSSGILGLTCAALLPLALCRQGIIRLVFGAEVFTREENLSFERQGLPKMFISILISTLLFLTLYVWIDAAGTKDFWFLFLKVVLSTLASSMVSVFIASILSTDTHDKWR